MAPAIGFQPHPRVPKHLAPEVEHDVGRADALARHEYALETSRLGSAVQKRVDICGGRVLQREVQPLENHLVDVFLPRVPHVDELADQRHAGGRQLGLAQQWDVAGFQHVPRLIGGRHQPRARPLAVVEIDPGPVGDVRRGVVNLVRADQSAVDHRRVGVPRGRWQQPPIGTGAADLRRAAGIRHFDLRPQPGALTGRVAVPAGAVPAAALRGRAVVIRPHRDHVAPWAQGGGDVVGVVGLEPGIASGRPPAHVRAVHDTACSGPTPSRAAAPSPARRRPSRSRARRDRSCRAWLRPRSKSTARPPVGKVSARPAVFASLGLLSCGDVPVALFRTRTCGRPQRRGAGAGHRAYY